MSATADTTTTTTVRVDLSSGVDYDRKYANEGRADQRGLEPCYVCGRGIKEGSGWRVEIVDGGGSAAMPGTADVNDPGYCGTYPIGSECGKRVPLAFRTKNV
jgi:hypothetical protein